MKKSDLLTRIQNIGTCTDDAQRRTMLAELESEASKDYDSLETFRTENESLKNDNEALRSANMKLFLSVGQSKTDDEINKDETGTEDKNKTKLTYDNLFDEKGGLK